MSAASSPEPSEQIRSLFREVVDLGPEERAVHLDQLPGLDPELRCELESLLEAHDRGSRLLDRLNQQPPWVLLSLTSAEAPLVGRRVSHYEIIEKLGGGGMGVVYRARDLKLERMVALKFLPPHLSLDEGAKARLIREAKASSELDHPNVCTIHEVAETDEGQVFIAMAYYGGETLKKKIERGPLPISEALDYAAQVAEGLQTAHEAGIVHRDIKPANVLVTEHGQVKLVDFGIAKVEGEDSTRTGATLGTAAYMSPEQTHGDAVDVRADLWSLGVVLYEMLTGVRPFRGEGEALVYGIRHDAQERVDALRPEVSAGLAQIIGRCLEKDPGARYRSAQELLGDLRLVDQGGIIPERGRAVSRSRRRGRLLYGGATALLVMVVGSAGLLSRSGGSGGIDSIAVLPVANLSGDPEQDYFAEGMTDLLINQLSQISGFERVIARTSVMRYRNTEKSPREIGRELGADALVEASAVREGERVRITVNLIEARTERSLWSRNFERPLRGVLALQAEVAEAIAREIEIALTPQEVARLTEGAPEVDPEAFALYLQAVQSWHELDPQERLRYLEEAAATDTTFALAYASLAHAYAVQSNDYLLAENAARHALALDRHLPSAHVALGVIRQWAHHDWRGAEAALRDALRLAPLDPRAHHELAMLLMRLGRFEEAHAAERRALYLDPTALAYRSGIGEILLYSRRYDEAIQELENTLRLHPGRPTIPWFLGEAYFHKGQYEEAARWHEQAWGIPPYVYAALGRRSEAEAALDAMLAHVGRDEGRSPPFLVDNLVRLYTTMGEHEQALHWLERAVEEHLGSTPIYLKIRPDLDPLRAEPRFQALLQKVGLDG